MHLSTNTCNETFTEKLAMCCIRCVGKTNPIFRLHLDNVVIVEDSTLIVKFKTDAY